MSVQTGLCDSPISSQAGAHDMLLLLMSYVCMLPLRKGGHAPVKKLSLAISTCKPPCSG